MLFSNIFKTSVNIISKRYIRKKTPPQNMKEWPNDWVPFHWKRPEKTPGYLGSGDLIGLEVPTLDELIPDVKNSEELKQLDTKNPIRQIFSLDHARRTQKSKALVQDHYKNLGLIHEIDYANSLEAKIIKLTYALRQIQERITNSTVHPRYLNYTKKAANSIKYRRNRYINELKELHDDRYSRLIKSLSIEPSINLINVTTVKPFRKNQMRFLTDEYVIKMKEKKVEEFMENLEEEKVKFANYKKETMAWIEEKEKELGIVV